MAFGVAARQLLAASGLDNSAWDVIDSSTLASPAASVSFTGIDSKYKLFRVTAYIVNDGSAKNVLLRLNNDSGSNYSEQRLLGSSTSVVAIRNASQTSIPATYTQLAASESATIEIVIGKQLASAAAMALISTVRGGASISKDNIAGIWANTADLISRIDLVASVGNFAAGTVVVLEGVPD